MKNTVHLVLQYNNIKIYAICVYDIGDAILAKINHINRNICISYWEFENCQKEMYVYSIKYQTCVIDIIMNYKLYSFTLPAARGRSGLGLTHFKPDVSSVNKMQTRVG